MFTTLHCAAQDLARLLLGAVTMLACAALQSRLHVVIEPSNQDLRHNTMIARYQSGRPAARLAESSSDIRPLGSCAKRFALTSVGSII
jgi:hypothetical protein